MGEVHESCFSKSFLRSNAIPHFTSPGMEQMSGKIPHSQSPILTPLSGFPQAVWPTYSPPYQVSRNPFTIVLFIKHSIFSQLHRNCTYVGRVEARYTMIACRQVWVLLLWAIGESQVTSIRRNWEVPWNLKQRLYRDFNPVTVISGHNQSALSNLIYF